MQHQQNTLGTEFRKEAHELVLESIQKITKKILARKNKTWLNNSVIRSNVVVLIGELCSVRKRPYYIESLAIAEAHKFFDKLNKKITFEKAP